MGAALTKEQFDRELYYRIAMARMDHLKEAGLLTSRQYRQVERIIAQKFPPVWANLPDLTQNKRKEAQ